ncbi:MAG: glycosyltransferase family 9 protein [Kiritimatiellia bacterium]
MPAVQLVRRHTGAVLEWVTQPEYVSLVRRVRGVERVVAYPRRDFFTARPAFRRELRRESCTTVLDSRTAQERAHPSAGGRRPHDRPVVQPRGLTAGFGARRPRPPPAPPPRRRLLPRHRPPPAPLADRVERGNRLPRWNPGAAPHIALASAFSRWPAKNWPLERFCAWLRPAARKPPAPCTVGGLADRAACEALLARTGAAGLQSRRRDRSPRPGGPPRPHGSPPVTRPDSGPMHMARAAGTRVLALFGLIDACRTGPRRDRHTSPVPRFTPADADSSAYKSGAISNGCRPSIPPTSSAPP